jgi:hypothetical protein
MYNKRISVVSISSFILVRVVRLVLFLKAEKLTYCEIVCASVLVPRFIHGVTLVAEKRNAL